MSFLNPVNEPVLRFSSTDADAPQINYAARTAGDVKAVLKACLVDGYGTTASAGWSVVNEVDNVCEFVSPSAAMGDYRLGIDDSSASSTIWYYQYRNSRTNPIYNNPSKSFYQIDNAHVSNGWQLFVTARGVIFVELTQSAVINKISARITYMSQVKSGLTGDGANLMFFNIGHSAAISQNNNLYSPSYPHFRLRDFTSTKVLAAIAHAGGKNDYITGVSNIDIVSTLYLASSAENLMLAELPGIASKVVNSDAEMFGVADYQLDTRSVFSVCAGTATGSASSMHKYSRTFLILTDYWEY